MAYDSRTRLRPTKNTYMGVSDTFDPSGPVCEPGKFDLIWVSKHVDLVQFVLNEVLLTICASKQCKWCTLSVNWVIVWWLERLANGNDLLCVWRSRTCSGCTMSPAWINSRGQRLVCFETWKTMFLMRQFLGQSLTCRHHLLAVVCEESV